MRTNKQHLFLHRTHSRIFVSHFESNTSAREAILSLLGNSYRFRQDTCITLCIYVKVFRLAFEMIAPFVGLALGIGLMARAARRSLSPFFARRNKHGKVVLVSNCAYWEIDNFGLVVDQMIALSNHAEREFAGALLRPHGPALRSMLEPGMPVRDIFEAAKEAGRQLVEDGMMSPKPLNIISRELVPLAAYASA